jgi:hypothetical protein
VFDAAGEFDVDVDDEELGHDRPRAGAFVRAVTGALGAAAGVRLAAVSRREPAAEFAGRPAAAPAAVAGGVAAEWSGVTTASVSSTG